MNSQPTVLVVEDNRTLADMYSDWLGETHDVVTAYDGRQALSLLTDRIDVVLLDRLMPDIHGDEVLSTIHQRGLDCRVALVTAVEPDFDIIDMVFDDYLIKPVFERDLYHAVEGLLTCVSYPDAVREHQSLAEKQSLLERRLSQDELAANEAYSALLADIESTSNSASDDSPRECGIDAERGLFRRVAHQLRSEAEHDT